MSDKYPSMSPYNYCAWNPVKLIDPDGQEVVVIGGAEKIAKFLRITHLKRMVYCRGRSNEPDGQGMAVGHLQ